MDESVRIGTAPRRLEARLALPDGAGRGAVVCHPHPQYGGTMDNAVVIHVARALVRQGHAVLRFNFGGVGASEGDWDGGVAEVADAQAACAALAHRLPGGAPLTLIGYSFGAWVALQAAGDSPGVLGVVAIAPPLAFFDWRCLEGDRPPVAFVVGTQDEFCPATRLAAVRTAYEQRLTVRTIAGADHFLVGREDEVAAAVVEEETRWDV